MSNIYVQHALDTSSKTILGVTPQSLPIPGRENEMARNNADGFTFVLDMWGILDRFIMLGTEGGNYYVNQKDVTTQAFDNTLKCIATDGARVIARVVEYSTTGRAPKNDPALVVLALAAAKGTAEVQAFAYDALPKVARTGTHLFTFVGVLNAIGKWNAAAKRGLAKWYTERKIERLAVQLLKYQSRGGWSHRDVLRLAHVKPANDIQSNLFKYVTKGAEAIEQGSIMPQLVVDVEYLKKATSPHEVVRLIESNPDISWEMVPTKYLTNQDVLMALLPSMGITALIRQLGKLSAANVIVQKSAGSKLVLEKLQDVQAIKNSRVHPITLLQAFKTYKQGYGNKGSLSWVPDQDVMDAVDEAFYASFASIESMGEGIFLGVDCSDSMFSTSVNGSPNLNAAEVAAVMALGILKKQSNYWIGGFNTKMAELKINADMRLDTVLEVMRRFSWGGTDISLVPLTALQLRMQNVGAMVTVTDNETWAGNMHPTQALDKYRREMNCQFTKQVVIGTSVSQFTVADPKDPRQMDIAGFDSAAAQIIADFIKVQ